jgi:phage tail sheath protein FI
LRQAFAQRVDRWNSGLTALPARRSMRDVSPDQRGQRVPQPNVYVEEASRAAPIAGARLDTVAFVGPTLHGPTSGLPALLTGVADFERLYGGADDLTSSDATTPELRRNYVAHAVRAFFDNGGQRCHVLRVAGRGRQLPTASGYTRAFARLRRVDGVALVAAPGYSVRAPDHRTNIEAALLRHVSDPALGRIALLDPPPGLSPAAMLAQRGTLDTARAALYYPWLTIANPQAGAVPGAPAEIDLPPSGVVAGVIARSEVQRGVHKAPANEPVQGALRTAYVVSTAEQEQLNPAGVNCLRVFAGRGLRVWGGRSLSLDPEWKYLNVRRYVDRVQLSITRGTQWVVFEPHGERLWSAVRQAIENFLFNEWQGGALLGDKPERAFFVRCDRSTMTQTDIDSGRLICLIGIAPLKPAEFLIFRIAQKTADAT